MFRKIDCIRIKVPSLEKGINFYSNELNHEILWKTTTAVGLKLPNSNSEIVIHTEPEDDLEVDFKVDDVVKASEEFVKAGGKILVKPFEIAIGKCCVVEDPFGNSYVILDSSKGVYKTDDVKDVIGLEK